LRGEPVELTKEQHATLEELSPERDRYFEFRRQLPYIIDLDSHLVVHAGIRPGVPLNRQMASDLTEIRTMGADPTLRKGTAWYEVYRGPQTILFGHWPKKKPRVGPFAIGLDTGCVYGRKLTAFIIETKEFHSVKARDAYSKKR